MRPADTELGRHRVGPRSGPVAVLPSFRLQRVVRLVLCCGFASFGGGEPPPTAPSASSVPDPASPTVFASASTDLPGATQTGPTASPTSPESSPSPAASERDRDRDRDTGRSRRSERRRDRGGSATSSSTSTNSNLPSDGTTFESFHLIPERNIFDVNRSGRSSRSAREPEPKPAKIDTLALVGAMSYAKGDFAFFDGSSSEYRKALKPGESIAGFQLGSIGRNSVQLESTGKTLELAIGSHLRREEEGEWRLVAEPASASSFASSGSTRSSLTGNGAHTTSPSTTSSTSKPSDSSGGSADDILQRLMKKREQEMK